MLSWFHVVLQQNPSVAGFEVADRFLLYRIENLDHELPKTDKLVPMAMLVNKEALLEFLLQKCKEQTIDFSKKFKPKQELISINEDLTQAHHNRKNFSFLEDEGPRKSLLNIENEKCGNNAVM